MRGFSRRQFLAGAGLTAAGVATASWGSFADSAAASARPKPAIGPWLKNPKASGIDHIVVLCMENRSFDHFLGWVPKANGKQRGLTYLDDAGNKHTTHHLTDWQGCGFNDPDHSYDGGRVQLAGGACNGFRKGRNDDFALGYYTRDDLPTTRALVDNFTIFDNWFCGILGPTYPNRFYTHAAATDRITNTTATSTLPTIWDSLSAAGVPANYYFSDLPFLGLFGQRMLPFCRRIEHFYADAAAGTLPAYSYLDPYFLGEDQGGSNDDHPHADIRRGQSFVSEVVRSVTQGPLWDRTLLLITYDEWGGFFDHVRPPSLPDAFAWTPTEEHNTAGFRVPTFVVSPFAPKGGISHAQFDHSSILKLVEWRFGLKSLNPRDTAASNPAKALDPSKPNLVAPDIPFVLDPGPHVCGSPDTGMAVDDSMWQELAASPAMRSFEAVS